MFNMSDISIELKSTEKSYTFPFKDTSPDSLLPNPSDIIRKQNRSGKLKFLLSPLNLKISFPLTSK